MDIIITTHTSWSNLTLKLLAMELQVHSPVDELHQQTLRRVLCSPLAVHLPALCSCGSAGPFLSIVVASGSTAHGQSLGVLLRFFELHSLLGPTTWQETSSLLFFPIAIRSPFACIVCLVTVSEIQNATM